MAGWAPSLLRFANRGPAVRQSTADASATDTARPPPKRELLHDDLIREYFELVNLVTSFDQRLLTIKGWGVTLSLASLGLGFQQDRYGLFLVAALSGIAFWAVEATTKIHQMRFYPRMGDIEVAMFELFGAKPPTGRNESSPLLDWSWWTGKRRVFGGSAGVSAAAGRSPR